MMAEALPGEREAILPAAAAQRRKRLHLFVSCSSISRHVIDAHQTRPDSHVHYARTAWDRYHCTPPDFPTFSSDIMDMPISSIMQRVVHPVAMDDTVSRAESLMKSRQVSAVPVYDVDGAVLGILTVGDLLRFHEQKRDPEHVKAWEICSYRPPEATPDTPLAEVAQLMLERHAHHVVVTEGGALKGIVSSLDFVRLYANQG
jgi:CBS domain-containing protein